MMEVSSCELCIVCGQGFSSINLGFLTPHSKEICLCCGKAVGKSCAKFGKTRPPLPEMEGAFCPECFTKERNSITGDGFLASKLHETVIGLRSELTHWTHDASRQMDRSVKEWLADADKRIENRLGDIQKSIQEDMNLAKGHAGELTNDIAHQLDRLVKGWLADADRRVETRLADVERNFQNSVDRVGNHLWVMLFFSVFIGFFGVFLFLLTKKSPDPDALIVIFRLGMVAMSVVPWGIWFVSSLFRAARNRSLPNHLREMREEKALGLRDYLFGIFYFRNPVHNLWLPIAVLGTIFSLFIYIIVQVWTQGA